MGRLRLGSMPCWVIGRSMQRARPPPRQRDKDDVSFGRPQKLAPEQKTRALLLVPKQIRQRSRPGWPFRLSAPEIEAKDVSASKDNAATPTLAI